MKELSAFSALPRGAALSVGQRRVCRALFFFILLSVPLMSAFTFRRLQQLLGDRLGPFSFFSSIVVADFACGLIVAKLDSRTRRGFIANTLLLGTAYTLLEFFLSLACWAILGWR